MEVPGIGFDDISFIFFKHGLGWISQGLWNHIKFGHWCSDHCFGCRTNNLSDEQLDAAMNYLLDKEYFLAREWLRDLIEKKTKGG